MPKQRLILIIGIILALIAVFFIKVYLDEQRSLYREQAKKALKNIQANQTAVLVAKEDIPRGAAIDPDILETKIVPNQYLQPQAVTSLDRIAGMVAIASISAGEQLSLTKLANPKQAGGGGLAESTPVGKRAITISVDNISSLAGMIKPSDYVDVIAMVPVPVQGPDGKQALQVAVMPLFQNVLVLAIGQNTGTIIQAPSEGRYKKEEKKEASPLITLALSPQEASLIAFVQEQGKIRLVLRSPADSQIEQVKPASWDTLFQYVMPKETREQPKEVEPPPPPEPKKEEPKPIDYVEIYRGTNKERVPLSK